MEPSGKIGLIVDDMFFAAKIMGAADGAGREIQRIKSLEEVERDIVTNPPSMLLIDLNSDRLNPLEVIEFFKSRPELGNVPIVGFLSHVQLDLKRRAELIGCDYVVPRSVFSQMLPRIVSGDLSGLTSK